MRRSITTAITQQWRELSDQGKSHGEIAQETGWGVRTVKKHLGLELQTRQARLMREDLFKERLGRHWDLLLTAVLSEFESLETVQPGQAVVFIESTRGGARNLNGALVERGGQGKISVRIAARELIEWDLLREHIPKDPIWKQVGDWEAALGTTLQAEEGLYRAIEKQLQDSTGLPILDWRPDRPALTSKAAETLLLWLLRPDPSWSAPMGGGITEEEDGEMRISASYIALAAGRREEITSIFSDTYRRFTPSSEVDAYRSAYDAHLLATKAIDRSVQLLRLLPYLAGNCEVCRRVEA